MIIDHLTEQGTMAPERLYEPRFLGIHYEGLEAVFPEQGADSVISIVRTISERARETYRAA